MKMKKIFDRYLFSRIGLQLLFSIIVILLFSLAGTVLRNWVTGHSESDIYSQVFWGFRQITDGGSMAGTLDGLDEVAKESHNTLAAPVVLAVALISWLIGMVLYGFVAGAVANAFAGRKEKIDAGLVRYRFRDHGLVIGWDFQGVACVRRLLESCREVLVVSGAPAAEIRDELAQSLSPAQLRCVYVCNGRVEADESLLKDSWPEFARRIVILGERDGEDCDGASLHVAQLVRHRIEDAAGTRGTNPVEVFLHVDDPAFYLQALSVKSNVLAAGDGPVELEVFNRFESWAWRCWSAKGARDGGPNGGGDAYLPLRHRPGAERVELFVIGAGPVGPTLARYALALMNYGEEGRHGRVTLFGCAPEDRALLPEQAALDALPECEVVFRDEDGLSDEANAAMVAAASDPKTAVTVVVVPQGADAAVRTYAGLSNTLRRMDISVLLWMPTATENLPPKEFLQTCGDCAKLRFFGMTDVLPWMDRERQEAGCAVNFFYGLSDSLPASSDAGFVAAARAAWDPAQAHAQWRGLPRWARWSSVNAADAFKERAAAFPDFASDPAALARLLRAEHGRWWTERLLSGWKPCEKPADKAERGARKAAFLHWDLVPFDRLDDTTKELDRVPAAAMAALGFDS